jgi:hypothetical protein
LVNSAGKLVVLCKKAGAGQFEANVTFARGIKGVAEVLKDEDKKDKSDEEDVKSEAPAKDEDIDKKVDEAIDAIVEEDTEEK